MTKCRIVKKQISGYAPTYEFQVRGFLYLWFMEVWSTDLGCIERYRDRYVSNLVPDEPLGVIWEN